MFPQLVQLHDRVEDEVSGAYLRELGLDPDRLIEGGLLERRDRQDVVLIEDDDIEGEGRHQAVCDSRAWSGRSARSAKMRASGRRRISRCMRSTRNGCTRRSCG